LVVVPEQQVELMPQAAQAVLVAWLLYWEARPKNAVTTKALEVPELQVEQQPVALVA
jgi:hypothetical protein